MAFGVRDLLAIYFPILLIYGFPPLGTMGRLAWWRLTYPKQFDRVWHASLLSKLPSFGFPPSLCLLMFTFLSNRSMSAVVDGATSSSFSVNSGVPQGSVLSPTLFLLFINDLLTCTSNSIHSYADDSTLHSSTHFNSAPSFTSRIASRLNLSDSILSDLDRISGWGRRI